MSVVVHFDPLRDLSYRQTKAGRACVDWLAYLDVEGKSPRTTDSYERTVAAVLLMFPEKTVDEFTDGDLLQYLSRVPGPSRRIKRAHLASFFNWARRGRLIGENPMDYMPKIRRTAKRVVPTFSDAERELLMGLPSPDGALFAILLEAGLRKGEARSLQVRHINWSTSALNVYRGKGDKDRIVPMSRRLYAALDDVVRLEGLNPDDYFWYTRPGGRRRSHKAKVGEGSFHRWYDDALARAGVSKDRRNPHATRHTFALRWLRQGGRLETLQQMLGHASIKTTLDEYGHLDETDIRRDLALMESIRTPA